MNTGSHMSFKRTVWEYYHAHKRPMPWREAPTPYHVLVSELMLQQTQVPRVMAKFSMFTTRFPDVASLAAAPLADVLAAWNGLGYNRRAKFLWEAAKQIQRAHGGMVPDKLEELVLLPGVGPNTAGAILAYAFNKPVVYVETNIRTVFIHHFFGDQPGRVTDKHIAGVVADTLDRANPREWYWALMDYGTHLKASVGAKLDRVHGYRSQPTFAGSRRQVRGQVLKVLLGGQTKSSTELAQVIADKRLPDVLASLHVEGLLSQTGGRWHLTGH